MCYHTYPILTLPRVGLGFGWSQVGLGVMHAFLKLGCDRELWLTEGITSKYQTNTQVQVRCKSWRQRQEDLGGI